MLAADSTKSAWSEVVAALVNIHKNGARVAGHSFCRRNALDPSAANENLLGIFRHPYFRSSGQFGLKSTNHCFTSSNMRAASPQSRPSVFWIGSALRYHEY